MSRCIDADALIDKYGDWYTEEGTEEGYIGTIKGVVDSMPTIEPQRKKGKWIYNSPVTMKCNQCGLVIKDWDWHRFKYCPNCCADMRGEQNG